MPFFGQLASVHLGRRRDPEPDRNVFGAGQQFASGPEMTNVGHAGSDKDLINLGTDHVRERLRIIGIVGAADDGFVDLVQIDLDHLGVLGILIGLEKGRIGKPGFHRPDSALEGAPVGISVRNHVLEKNNIGMDVFDDRLRIELDRTPSRRALSRRIRELKRLFDFQVGQALDFENAPREDIDFALFGNCQQAPLDRIKWNGMDQIAQRDAGLHGASKAHED